MSKDEALKLALEFVDANHSGGPDAFELITAIKQALAQPVQEPVAWKWHQAPVKTSWGHKMVVADLAIDKDNTVSVYCERDQTTKVEAMFNPPAAQPAPVQEPVGCMRCSTPTKCSVWGCSPNTWPSESTTPPAAQRQWVGLIDTDIGDEYVRFEIQGARSGWRHGRAIEAKLRSKNT